MLLNTLAVIVSFAAFAAAPHVYLILLGLVNIGFIAFNLWDMAEK